MNTEKDSVQKRNKARLIRRLVWGGRMPKSVLVLLVVLFIIPSIAVTAISRTQGSFPFAGFEIPLSVLPGVLTSFANMCLILMVVFFGKPGLSVALALLLVQFPLLSRSLFVYHAFNSIPGFTMNIFTIIFCLLIYNRGRSVEKAQSKLLEQAVTDSLTGLPNRLACTEFIGQLVESGEPFTLVSVDLNDFKGLNDTMGHGTGNAVLIEAASRWKALAEAGEGGAEKQDFIARQGGDEFAFVLRAYASDEELRARIAAYETALEQPIGIDGCDYFITASFGYAAFPEDAGDSEHLLSYADAAMFEAKHMSSRLHLCRFTPDLLNSGEHTLALERKLRSALEGDKLFFHLQPQFDLSHRLRGFEALARMRDEDGTMISPAEFIPVAEKAGLIDQVDFCVFRGAAGFFGQLVRRTGSELTLSVNVSVRHLMKKDFVDEVREVLKTSGIPAKQLELEITESILIESPETALRYINELRELGVKIAIDDFGTGYSSLSYLNSFPADMLKVDKSFIDTMNSSDSSRKYVAAIISIGHIMHFDVISEGVEDPAQLDTLRSIGCDYIQGFLWGRPMTPEAAEALVAESMKA